jgi:hypothetical protein
VTEAGSKNTQERVFPPLSRGRYRLRPLLPSDYEEFYRAEVIDAERLVRYRHRGIPPSTEVYAQTLWQDVVLNFVAGTIDSDQPSGLLTIYGWSQRNQTAKVALSSLAEVGDALTTMRCLPIFLDYVFAVHPIRKLYGEVLEWNESQFSSLVRFGARLEGRLIGHELHGFIPVDLLVYGISREAWLSFHAVAARSGTQATSPSESVASLLGVDALVQVDFSAVDSLEFMTIASMLEDDFDLIVPDSVVASKGDEGIRDFLRAADLRWSESVGTVHT